MAFHSFVQITFWQLRGVILRFRKEEEKEVCLLSGLCNFACSLFFC